MRIVKKEKWGALLALFAAVAVVLGIDVTLRVFASSEPTVATAAEVHTLHHVWQKPLDGTVTSPFGERTNPISGKEETHYGQDIAAPLGTPIALAADGVVCEVGENTYDGNFVLVDHGENIYSKYCHCSDILVQNGYRLRRGETIALVGDTGWATGAHLHVEIILNGKYADPSLLW